VLRSGRVLDQVCCDDAGVSCHLGFHMPGGGALACLPRCAEVLVKLF
jgi:hypothetical protein